MKKISIITRAYNRLEYTIRCINAVKNNTLYENYEHVILNNKSSDGTKEWLNWITCMNNDWFKNVVVINSPTNHGDWGGMVEGLKHVSSDSKYIVQLDNDIEVPKGWLTVMVKVLELVPNKIVMLKRTGVQTIMKTTHCRKLGTGHEGGDVPMSVACYIIRKNDVERTIPKVKACREIPKALGGPCFKIISMTCHQMEGWDGKNYIQHEKYLEKNNETVDR